MIHLLGEVAGSEAPLGKRRRSLMDGLCQLVDADAWILIKLGRRKPGELPTFSILLHGGFTEQRFADFLRANEHPDMRAVNQPFLEELSIKKSHLTRLSQQADSEGRFHSSEAVTLWKKADLAPLILSYWPTGPTEMSGVVLFRRFDQEFFSERESRMVHIVVSEVPWLHDESWSRRSGCDGFSISPRLNTVLNLLLQGHGRKQIATQLGISINTVNGYAKELYRRFGVHSQAELIRRFVEGDGGDSPER